MAIYLRGKLRESNLRTQFVIEPIKKMRGDSSSHFFIPWQKKRYL